MKFFVAFFISLLLSASLHAENVQRWPHNLTGVYKEQFDNGLIDGTQYRSENILELVTIDASRIYMRTHLDFYNGHVCNIHGWLTAQDEQTLIFHDPVNACEMNLQVKDGNIVFNPQTNDCNRNCGMRGSLNNQMFKLSAKRPIRYLSRLKNSDQYQQTLKAIEEDTGQKR